MTQSTHEPARAGQVSHSTSLLSRLSLYSLLGGSTSLIPLPWVDDWAYAWVRRQLIIQVCRPGLALDQQSLNVLLNRGRTVTGRASCLVTALSAPFRLVVYLVSRLFRKIFFFLAMKEATDRASELFHEGYLLALACARPGLHAAVRQGEAQAVRQLAYAVVETLQETDTSPLRLVIVKATQGSWRLLFAAARRLRQLIKAGGDPQRLEREEKAVLARPLAQLTRLLQEQWPYFRSLEQKFQEMATRRRLW